MILGLYRMPKSVSVSVTLVFLSACASSPPPEASSQPPPVQQIRASVPQRPFAPESGRLHVDSRHFYDAANHVWRWRGASQFLLFARYLNGEDISPQLDWLEDRGFNVLRVFGEVPAGFVTTSTASPTTSGHSSAPIST